MEQSLEQCLRMNVSAGFTFKAAPALKEAGSDGGCSMEGGCAQVQFNSIRSHAFVLDLFVQPRSLGTHGTGIRHRVAQGTACLHRAAQQKTILQVVGIVQHPRVSVLSPHCFLRCPCVFLWF